MNTSYPGSEVVCLGPAKEAALYFDKVFPLDLGTPMIFGNGTSSSPAARIEDLLRNYVPLKEQLADQSVLHSLLGDDVAGIAHYYRHTSVCLALILIGAEAGSEPGAPSLLDMEGWSHVARDLDKLVDFNLLQEIRRARRQKRISKRQITEANESLNRIVEDAGFGAAPAWEAAGLLSPFRASASPTLRTDIYFASLSGLNLVDLDRAEWAQIVEFRKDPDAKAALRNLRLFFADNYEGKDEAYVADSLHSALDSHERAIKAWGFDTVLKTFEVAFSKDSLLSSSVAGLSTALSGASLPMAAGVSAAITFGACAIKIGREIRERDRIDLSRPIRYVTLLRERFGSEEFR